MIHARIDLVIMGHRRAYEAGPEAMGLWLFAVGYAREQETDGFIPAAILHAAWGGRQNAKLAARLVAAGLLESVLGGYQVAKYEAKNELKWQIDERRAWEAKRKSERRTRGTSGNVPVGHPWDKTGTPASVPAVSVGSEPEPEPEPEPDQENKKRGRPRAVPDDPGTNPLIPAAWAGEVIATVAMVGLRTPSAEDLPAVWATYAAHAQANCKPISREGWQYWLTNHHVRGATPKRGPLQLAADPVTTATRIAYAEGLAEGLGRPLVVRWVGSADNDVLDAFAAHGRGKGGGPLPESKRDDWVRLAASDFGAWLRSNAGEAKFFGDGAPSGFGRWLNREAAGEEARRIGS